MMKRVTTLGLAAGAILSAAVPGCSKAPAKIDPCGLVPLSDAQSVDAAIVKSQWFPPKKGETDELCMYQDANGDARVMLFVWRDKSDAFGTVRSGMKSAVDRVVEVGGVDDRAAAGFSASDGDSLKLFAAESKGRMIGIRPRDPIKEGDEKFNAVKALAAKALGRLK